MPDLPDLANRDYVNRVNRAIDHITRHLAEPLKLDEVAKIAAFSPFHFHRIFRAVVGETLLDFVKRTRLERALYLMSHDKRSLTEVALEVGFSSSSDFSRVFKAQFGVPPRAFDLEQWRKAHRERLFPRVPEPSATDDFPVHIRELPARRVAYLRVFDPYQPDKVRNACLQLVEWAKARGLEKGQWLGYMWEEPELVPLEKCRYDVGLVVPEGVALSDEVGEQRLPAMKVAEIEIKGSLELESKVIEWVYSVWLPRSGYVPDHQPSFEVWQGLPFAHGEQYFELFMHLAVTK
ncbi:MAG: AraC family transcriptional regulator [Myxococcaceae bacterium]|nr:AraC family transcriptional regulator [Myxococcaceae bacterium]